MRHILSIVALATCTGCLSIGRELADAVVPAPDGADRPDATEPADLSDADQPPDRSDAGPATDLGPPDDMGPPDALGDLGIFDAELPRCQPPLAVDAGTTAPPDAATGDANPLDASLDAAAPEVLPDAAAPDAAPTPDVGEITCDTITLPGVGPERVVLPYTCLPDAVPRVRWVDRPRPFPWCPIRSPASNRRGLTRARLGRVNGCARYWTRAAA